MGKLLIKEKEIVTPGEELAEGMDFLPSFGTFRDGENIYANRLGIMTVRNRVIKVIPLSGRYLPNVDDTIVGVVTDIGFSGWMVDIGANGPANLPVGEAVRERVDLLKSDLSRYFNIGDVVMAKIFNAAKSRMPQLSMRGYGLRKLRDGIIKKISPTKVPRLIGKGGSMVSLIKEYTKCSIYVGQNGYVLVSGPTDGIFLVEEAIDKIAENSHVSGLTDMIKEFLEKKSKKVKDDGKTR